MTDTQRMVPLAEVTDKIGSGATPRGGKAVYRDMGVAFIRSQNVEMGRFVLDGIARLDEEAATQLDGVAVEPGDVLINITGESVGRTCRVPAEALPARVSQHVAIIRPRSKVIDAEYLNYALQAPQSQLRLEQLSQAGATRRALTKGHLARFEVPFPPLEEQRRIAGVLGALDDLAARAADLARRCDAMLQASWEERESSCTQSRVFSDFCSVKKGVSYKGKFLASAGTPMLNLANFGRDGLFKPDGMKYYTGEIKQDRILDRGALVVANTDLTQACDILGRPAIVPEAGSTSTHHTFQVNVPGGEAQRMWIYATLRHPDVRRSLVAHATGTTVTALPQRSLEALAVPWPGDDAVTKWWAEVKPLFTAQSELLDEAEQCRATRDELLPLLLSGRVRVGEVAA